MNKKVISGFAVLALGATLAVAAPNQEGKGQWKHHRDGMFSEKLAAKLNLSDAQKQQMKDIKASFRANNKAFFESFHQNAKALRAAKEAGDTAKVDALKATVSGQREQMKALRAAQRTKMESVLTPDQRAQLEQIKAAHAARRAAKSDSK